MEKPKINVILQDGIVLDVLGNQEAFDMEIDLTISLLDSEIEEDNKKLEACYEDQSTLSIPYTTD